MLFQKLHTNRILIAFIIVFLLGAGLRAVNVWHGVERASWREADVSAIARNFYREGMNILTPRIDWRGDGKGYTESEFPVFSWLMALFYQFFGIHEVFGRFLAYAFSIGALVIFFKLAHYLLTETEALLAAFFFAVSPLTLQLAVSLQPDGLMFFCYLLAAYSFIRWLDDEKPKHYALALIATALAILIKGTAINIGVFFAALILSRFGWNAFKQKRLWVFAVLALLPGVIWYSYARYLWVTYGNSLGLSNEYHWAGTYLINNPEILTGVFQIDIENVWMPTGIILAAFGTFLKSKEKVVNYSLWWLTAIFICYLLTAYTTGRSWAKYYHVFSVIPAALLIGTSIEVFKRFAPPSRRLFQLFGAVLFGLTVVAAINFAVNLFAASRIFVEILVFWGFSCVGLWFFSSLPRDSKDERITPSLPGDLIIGLTILSLVAVFSTAALRAKQTLYWERSDFLDCATKFSPLMTKPGLIVASGGECFGPAGKPLAYNASYFFYWLDRKGFNLCVEDQTTANLEALKQRGAKYFVAERSALDARPDFAAEIRRNLTLVSECENAFLFELK